MPEGQKHGNEDQVLQAVSGLAAELLPKDWYKVD